MITRIPSVALVAASVLLTGCGGGALAATDHTSAPPAASSSAPSPSSEISAEAAPRQLPGVGPKMLARIPATTEQVVLVTGRGEDSPLSTLALYERTDDGWEQTVSWAAHNALKGWSDHHMAGDLRSPIGVYSLTDAGGLLKDPGTKLSYDHGSGFVSPGTGFEGEPLAGSFDYVIAINYNRLYPALHPRLDPPLGASRGGGIWIHVDHGGPTHGCVSIAEDHMKELLRTLDPARHPVVVMGDAAALDH